MFSVSAVSLSGLGLPTKVQETRREQQKIKEALKQIGIEKDLSENQFFIVF